MNLGTALVSILFATCTAALGYEYGRGQQRHDDVVIINICNDALREELKSLTPRLDTLEKQAAAVETRTIDIATGIK